MIRKINPVYSSYASSTKTGERTMSELMKYGSTKQIAQLIGVVTYPVKEITREEVENMLDEFKQKTQCDIEYQMCNIITDILPEEVENEVSNAMGEALQEGGIIESIIKEKVVEIADEEIEQKVIDVIESSAIEDTV